MLDPTNNRLNGLDVAAFDAMIEAVQTNPTNAACGFEVKTQWTGATRTEARVEAYTLGGARIPRAFTIVADEPEELGGDNTAPNPQELLMAAVNACMTVGYVEAATMMGIQLDSLEITMRGELDLRGVLGLDKDVPAGYRSLDYIVRLKGDGTSEQFAVIHDQVMATSPNYFNMARPIRMNGTLFVD